MKQYYYTSSRVIQPEHLTIYVPIFYVHAMDCKNGASPEKQVDLGWKPTPKEALEACPRDTEKGFYKLCGVCCKPS